MQLVSIVMTLSGAIMVAFGYRVREGIEKTLRKELEIDKRKLVVPADVEKVPVLFYGGLLMIILAALVQLLLLA